MWLSIELGFKKGKRVANPIQRISLYSFAQSTERS